MINLKNTTISHLVSHDTDTLISLERYRQKLRTHPSLTLPLDETLQILEELKDFDFGRFLLMYRGLNGYWTSHVAKNSFALTSTVSYANDLERWIYHQAPSVRAHQERVIIFQQQVIKHLQQGFTVAAIPCGLMDGLLMLSLENFENITFVGIDLDQESLALARAQAIEHNHNHHHRTNFYLEDAWNMSHADAFNIITSNGLNHYVPETEKVIALYRKFHQALKTDGLLILSFFTPPPNVSSQSPWRDYSVKNWQKQKAIFNDILDVKWQSYRTEEDMRNHLHQAGFSKIVDVIYDSQCIFPTNIAQK